MMNTRQFIAIFVGLGTAISLAGCGGSGAGSASSPAGRGAIRITVKWPAPSRLIPIMSQSIAVTVTDHTGALLTSQPVIVTKPVGTLQNSSATIPNLPADPQNPVRVDATAYPTSTGTGTKQATGHVGVTVVSGQTTTAPQLTMGTTITQIDALVSGNNFTVGQVLVFDASAKDASGNIVLTADASVNNTPNKWTGTMSDPTAVSINQSGSTFRLTCLKQGSFTFTVKENESGVSASPFNFTVTPPPPAVVTVLDQTNIRYVGLSDAAPGATYTPTTLGTPADTFAEDMATDTHGNVYVAEGSGTSSGAGVVVEYDSTGTEVGHFHPQAKLQNGTTYYLTPYQICVDPQGRIYIHVQLVDEVNGGVKNTVYRYDSIAANVATLKQVQLPFQFPVGMASDGTYLYVTDGAKIYRINADLSGVWSSPYGSRGNGADNFAMTTIGGKANHGLALDPSGTHLYVADYLNNRIVQIATAGFNSLPSTTAFNFTGVNLSSSGTNGANYFKPISVSVDGANQHLFFTGVETKDTTSADYSPPTGTNVVNSFVERIDVAGVATHSTTNRTVLGGAFATTPTANQFGRPMAVGAK